VFDDVNLRQRLLPGIENLGNEIRVLKHTCCYAAKKDTLRK